MPIGLTMTFSAFSAPGTILDERKKITFDREGEYINRKMPTEF
jgi:hypothetical protein